MAVAVLETYNKITTVPAETWQIFFTLIFQIIHYILFCNNFSLVSLLILGMLILCQPTLITYGLCTRFFGTNISPNVLQLHIYLGNCNSQEVINFLPSFFLKTSSQYQLHISPPLELYMYFNNSPTSAWNCTSGILFCDPVKRSKHQCILISLTKPGKYIGNAILTKPGWNCTWASSFSVSCSCWRNQILWCQLLGILGVQYLHYSLPGSICFQIQHLKTVWHFCLSKSWSNHCNILIFYWTSKMF